MPAAAIGPAIAGGTSLLGGILGSGAAKQASSLQAGVLNQNSNQLIGVGQQMQKQELNRLQPYIQSGQQGVNTLAGLLKTPGQGLLQGYGSFQPPTGLDMQNDPGYQARLQLGMEAIQNSAASRGDLLSGNTLKGLTDYGQTFGSNEYQNVYNRAANTYGTNQQNFYQNQGNQFGRLMGQAGMGLQAGGMANQANQAYQNLYGDAMGMSNQAGQVQAQGIMGQNAGWQQALGGMANAGMNYSTLAQLGQMGGGNQMSPDYGSLMTPQSTPSYGGSSAMSDMALPGSSFAGQVPGMYSPSPSLNGSGYAPPSVSAGAGGPAGGGFNVGAWPNVTSSWKLMPGQFGQ